VEKLTNTKEDLMGQLCDKDTELANANGETTRLDDTLERYQSQHISCAEMLHNDMLELLGQCNLEASPTSFPGCTGAFYEWVSSFFNLVMMNTKIFGELGAAVGVRTLVYPVCSLVPQIALRLIKL
jgi:hypothetical protein